MNAGRYWDEEEACKGDSVYQTRNGRLRALNHITRKYLEKTLGEKVDYTKSMPVSLYDTFKIFANDLNFRKFTFDNYHVHVFVDKKFLKSPTIRVVKYTSEMIRFINDNPGKWEDEEFVKKLYDMSDSNLRD